jgi:hypothetical protein
MAHFDIIHFSTSVTASKVHGSTRLCVCAQRAREEAAKAAELQYHAVVMERTEREFEVRV